jgi:putative SOS response-associated peptidase YedK
MCGRYMLATPRERLIARFRLQRAAELLPRFNIAPSESIAAIRENVNHERELVLLRWGLIPSTIKDTKNSYRMINARAETVSQRPAFRAAFAHRRCLIPADGFYEWQRTNDNKQPYFVRAKDENPLAFAGLWERWQRGQEVIESCTIITTSANESLAPIHDRMPAILREDTYDLWLDPSVQDLGALQALLLPCDAKKLVAYPVSKHVNHPKNDDAECIRQLQA